MSHLLHPRRLRIATGQGGNLPGVNRPTGIAYAEAADGMKLPVVDVTHPAFAIIASEREIEAAQARYLAEMRVRARLPGPVRRWLVGFLVRRSTLLRAAIPGQGDHLRGMATYLMKLGPQNLGPAFTRFDRKLAAGYAPLALRVRLQEVSALLADGLTRALAARAVERVELVNLGGGPAMDSLNALIRIEKARPELLAGRHIGINVFDRDEIGPSFGARALEALRAPGGALEGVDAHFERIAHDWNRVPTLRDALARIAEGSPVMVGSSEGALFDYGSDEAIIGNLVALRETTPDDFRMVGDAIRDSELVRLSGRETGFQFRALGREGFEALARQAGWEVEAAVDEPACLAFRLVKG